MTLALSEEPAPAERHRSFPAIALASGTIDAVLRRHITGPCLDTIAFVGGPPPMVHATVYSLIRSVRFSANRIRYDRSW